MTMSHSVSVGRVGVGVVVKEVGEKEGAGRRMDGERVECGKGAASVEGGVGRPVGASRERVKDETDRWMSGVERLQQRRLIQEQKADIGRVSMWSGWALLLMQSGCSTSLTGWPLVCAVAAAARTLNSTCTETL